MYQEQPEILIHQRLSLHFIATQSQYNSNHIQALVKPFSGVPVMVIQDVSINASQQAWVVALFLALRDVATDIVWQVDGVAYHIFTTLPKHFLLPGDIINPDDWWTEADMQLFQYPKNTQFPTPPTELNPNVLRQWLHELYQYQPTAEQHKVLPVSPLLYTLYDVNWRMSHGLSMS